MSETKPGYVLPVAEQLKDARARGDRYAEMFARECMKYDELWGRVSSLLMLHQAASAAINATENINNLIHMIATDYGDSSLIQTFDFAEKHLDQALTRLREYRLSREQALAARAASEG